MVDRVSGAGIEGALKRYAITEGLGAERALRFVAHNLERGVEMIQIREKALGQEELRRLVATVMGLPNPFGTKIVVNGPDAMGADGVHLPTLPLRRPRNAGLRPALLREQAGGLRYIGISCHSIPEVVAAEVDGADFLVFGPVFATGDKTPVGLEALRAAASAVRIPVFALGGVTEGNAASCIAAGAAGIAGIRLFRP